MKRILLLMAITALLFSCSKNEETLTETQEPIDLTLMVNPSIDKPESIYDTKPFGMYHGVVISKQADFHGKIWISLYNNNKSSALVSDNTNEIYFYLDKQDSNGNSKIFHFKGKSSSFDLNLTDYKNPIVENVTIKNEIGLVNIVKDRSDQRAMAILGVYEDDADPAFNGTWDVISSGISHAELGFGFYFQKVVITNPNGTTMQEDTTFENFDYPCYGATAIQPEFENDPNGTGYVDIVAQNQQSPWGDDIAYYDIGFSNYLSDNNSDPSYESGFLGFEQLPDYPFDCYIFLDHGYWAWKTRTGTITFDTSALITSTLSLNQAPKKAIEARSISLNGFNKYIYQLKKTR
tara:strand:- start:1655 stop:2701 length:1047 start_codon:yes stop_codon:yes gene_type:complete